MTFMQKVKVMWASFWTFIQPTVKDLMTEAGTQLMRLALKYVLMVSQDFSVLDGKEKQQKVFEMIMADLKKLGISFATGKINKFIELAYDKLKDEGKIQ